VIAFLPNYLEINSLVINDSVNNPFDASCIRPFQIRYVERFKYQEPGPAVPFQSQARLIAGVTKVDHLNVSSVPIEDGPLFAELLGHNRALRANLVRHLYWKSFPSE
jgi:hypothetical protein